MPFRTALAVPNGFITQKLIKKLNSLVGILVYHVKCHGDFSKKKECDSIIQNWQMIFQSSDYKGNNFLDLLDDNYLPIKPTYI